MELRYDIGALDQATRVIAQVIKEVQALDKQFQKLDGKTARLEAKLEGEKPVKAGLDEIKRKVKNLDGKKATVKVDVDKSLSDSIVKVAQFGRALRSLALPTAAIAAAPQIAAIGAAVVQASGAIGILPGVAGAAALAVGTLKVGFSGFGDAMKAAGDPQKFAEAIKDMSPAARATATELRDLVNGPLKQLRQVVQEHLFAGMANEVKGLAATYLPALQSQMQRVASVFNVAGQSVFDFFQRKAVASDLTAALNSLRLGVQNVVLAARPLAQVFVDVFSTSAARIPALTQGLAAAASKFAGFISAARQSGQLGQWIDTGIQTVKTLGQVVTNVGSILLSVFRSASVQGANLVQTLADVTGMAAAFLKSVQGQQALTAFFGAIRAAVDAIKPAVVALLPLFADLVRLVGNNLVAVFQALGPPLQQVAAALSNALRPVLPVIVDGLRQIALAMVPMIAQAQALTPAFHAIAQALAAAAQVAAGFFSGMATVGLAAFKTIVPLITLAADALTVLLHVIEPIAPALGAVVAAFFAFKAASAGISAVQGIFTTVAKTIADTALNAGVFTEKVTGSAAAGQNLALVGGRLSTALGAVSVALPIIAVAAAGVAFAYDQMRDKSDELATSVINSQMSMGVAVAEQSSRLQEQTMVMEQMQGEGYATGQAIGELTGQLQSNADQADATAQAYDQVSAAAEVQLSKLPPLEQAQARVRFEEERYATAVQLFGQNSPQAIAAQEALSASRQRAKDITQQVSDAEKTLGDRIVDTTNAAAAAANADVGYQQSLLTLRDAQDRAAEAAANHGAKSRELEQANLAVQQASLSAAAAAQRKAEADATAAGASNVAQIGAQAYKDELLRQAATMEGPAKQALIDLANGTDVARQASATAEIQSRLQKDELGRLAGMANGPVAAALAAAKQNFDTLGGAHANAEQRAAAQKAELLRLANMASGPVRQSLLDMANQIRTLPSGQFTVTGVGNVSYGSPELARAAHGGHTGGIISMGRAGLTGVAYATGGVMPGYTPGRDVHTFRSATGGTLELSGGEAVMRPEWTQAVGPQNVHRMNAAARNGGVTGVQRYMTTGRYADGGILPTQRFAMGGDIRLTGRQPFPVIPKQLYGTIAGSLVGTITSTLNAAIRALAAQAAAMAAAAATRVAGGVTVALGGGGARAWIIAHESGGNPRAKNPTSTASGLYQMINGTWKAYGGSTPTAAQASVAEQNAVADRYVAARYGSWENAQRFWMSHHYYDRGGLLPPGVTMAVNNTGTSERILSPSETRTYNQVRSATAGGGARTGGDGAALIAELQTQNRLLRALRGDVDQTGSFNALIGEIRGLRYQLAAGGGSAGMKMQADRTASELGAWL